MRTLSSEWQGALLAIAAGLLYSLVGYFGIELVATNLSIANMQFWRFLVSGLFIVLISFGTKQLYQPWSSFFKLAVIGGIFYSSSAGTYFIACQYIGTGPSMVIFFAYPAFVLFINWLFYKIKVANSYYPALSLILLGMPLLADLSQFTADLIGIALAILSALLYASYIVYSKKISLAPLGSTVAVSVGCAFCCLIQTLYDDTFSLPTTWQQGQLLIGFGIISTAIPMLLFLESLKRIEAEKASILSVLEPVCVVILGVLLLDETLDSRKLLGISIILSGALITLLNKRIKFFSKTIIPVEK